MSTNTCKNCHSPINKNAKFCEKCGNPVNDFEASENHAQSFSIAGFVCSLCGFITCGISSIVGLILSIIGLVKSRKNGYTNGFAVAGIVISCIPLLYFFSAVTMGVISGITEEEQTVEIIDFSNLSRQEVKDWCQEHNLKCNIKFEYSDDLPSGSFISQEVKPGEEIAINKSIDIMYSKGAKEKTSATDNNNNVNSNEKFTLIEHYVSDESNMFAMYIEGKIKNNRDRNFSYVQVTFTAYDAEGNTIGTCLDNQSGLNANGIWKFKAICSESADSIDHYDLKEISGW